MAHDREDPAIYRWLDKIWLNSTVPSFPKLLEIQHSRYMNI